MVSGKRKERERDERRSRILEAAIQIINEEGLEKLSVRKIAAKIEYSPAIVYHYFQNKDDLVGHLIGYRYAGLVRSMQLLKEETEKPELLLARLTENYINWALENGELYKAMMLNSTSGILMNTAVLAKGAAANRPALKMLAETLMELGLGEEQAAEMTAQILWSATFGLTIRMIIEHTPPEQRQRLISRHINLQAGAVRALQQA